MWNREDYGARSRPARNVRLPHQRSSESITPMRTFLAAALALLLVGCADRYVGTWSGSSRATTTDPTGALHTQTGTSTVTISQGTTVPYLVQVSGFPCTLNASAGPLGL